MKETNELLDKVLYNTTDDVYVQCPCEVTNVHGNFVDILLYINDEEPDMEIYNVPIVRQETQRAYIFLGIKKGDRGVCRFFDRSVEGYLQSDFDYNSDDRQHDINDRCFELGFIPDKEAFVYPTDKEIEIGLKNGNCKISVASDGTLDIISTVKTNITAPTVNITGNVNITGDVNITGAVVATGEITGNSIPLSMHKHLAVTTGLDTSGTPTT